LCILPKEIQPDQRLTVRTGIDIQKKLFNNEVFRGEAEEKDRKINKIKQQTELN